MGPFRHFSTPTNIDSSIPESTLSSNVGTIPGKLLFREVTSHIERQNLAAAEKAFYNFDLSKIEEPARIFSHILAAYAESNRPQEVVRAFESLLEDPRLPNPDRGCFNVYLKSAPLSRATMAFRSMRKLEIANIVSFNTMISVYCHHNRPDDALNILEELLKYSEENPHVQPDQMSYSPLINAFGRLKKPQQAEKIFQAMRARDIVPDLVTWSAIFHAWADSRQSDAHVHVMRLWEEMDKDVIPDTAMYNSIMLALANDVNRGPEAEDLLKRMPSQPTDFSYGICMLAWKNSPGIPDAVERAEALAKAMQKQGLQPNVVVSTNLVAIYADRGMPDKAEAVLDWMEYPNIVSYSSVLNAWAKSGRDDAISRSFQLLERMKVRPNIITFNTLINVVEKNRYEGKKAEIVKDIFSIMEQAGCVPNSRTLTTVLNLYANEPCGDEPLQLALSCFEQIRSKFGANNVAYLALFKALTNHKAPFETIEKMFRICCEDRSVDKGVMTHIFRSCHDKELKKLFPDLPRFKTFDLSDLPPSWTGRGDKEGA